ncbi:MAG: PhnD/SsuA/transferrin family substrate-binding protein, partial [Acidobacteria bacterium]|nr:PhnD/SsuA/transferrin family substrate-binding protein [Acidobacteriota bacterium]
AKEMNPQLGQLRVLARSRPMIEGVICVSTEPNPLRQELIDAMLSLHKDPRGHQVLMVFKTDRLVPIQPGDLDSARELWRDYERLPGSSPSRSSSAGPAPAAILQAAESNQAGRTKEGH